MDTIGLIVMVVVLVLVIGGIFGYIKTQRELVNLDEKCKNALSQIEVQLNSRWDALMSLAKLFQSCTVKSTNGASDEPVASYGA